MVVMLLNAEVRGICRPALWKPDLGGRYLRWHTEMHRAARGSGSAERMTLGER
jgi:hypothetical protein